MKRILAAALGVPAIALPALAQSPCFLRGPNGERVDLGHLCGSSPPPSAPQAGVFQVPIKRREGGIPVIDVTLNGRHTFEMLLDTGATAIAVTAGMAEAMGIRPQGSALVDTAAGRVQAKVGKVSSVRVGGLEKKDVPVIITPGLSKGLLGHGFFGSYDLTIKQDRVEFRQRS